MLKVNRFPPELVAPAKPTPHEFKSLSDLDSCIRVQVPNLFIYPHKPSMNGVDLVRVIKNALSLTLVRYYPLAGRLREDPSGKLVVECTGEGVLFIEADADVTLDRFGYPLVPPFVCSDQLLFDVPGSSDILNCPLILIQMTRLKCGGLIIGVRLNHCIMDAFGLVQFMSAIAEMAKGATSVSVLPTWERHIFNSNSKNLQQSTSSVAENNIVNDSFDINDLSYRVFFFGQIEITALQEHIPLDFGHCSSFEMVISCVWKCRVLALASDQDHPTEEIIEIIWPMNLRKRSNIPLGYYGNALMYSVVKSTEKVIIENPLSYTLQLVRNDKEIVTGNYDALVTNLVTNMKNYMVSDITFAGMGEIDFGWGKPAYGGPALCLPSSGFCMPFNHRNGEKGVMVLLCLPTKAMERFEQELDNILKGKQLGGGDHNVAKSKL